MRVLPPEEAKRTIRAKLARWKRERTARPKPEELLQESISKGIPPEAARSLDELRQLLEEGDSFMEKEVLESNQICTRKVLREVPTDAACQAMNRFQALVFETKERYRDYPEVLEGLYDILAGYCSSELFLKLEAFNTNKGIYKRIMKEITG